MSDDPNYVEQNENTMTKNFTVVDQQGVPISGVHVFTSNSNVTVTDIDGNAYATLKIGEQVWMTENLKVTHYDNGDAIQYQPHSW